MERNSLGLDKPASETKVCVAMSGGVDSSVAAYLLQKEGYRVFGLTMDLLEPPYAPAAPVIADAAKVAAVLGIEHRVLDLKKEFRRHVVDYFCETYLNGQTPSPCILCNRHIKLGILADEARKAGADLIVTGHYAEIKVTSDGAELHKGKDPIRDQSYFLFNISRENLQMLRCPLSAFDKTETRKIAAEAGLPVAQKSDSQDICFVAEGKYAQLIDKLRSDFENVPGNIITTDGKIIGRHKGIIHYTVGQRRGLNIGGGTVYYVIRLDAANNSVVVGTQEELFTREVRIEKLNLLCKETPPDGCFTVKLRSRQKEVPAEVFFGKDEALLRLAEDFAAAAPGQGCCIYDGTRVVGGGFIVSR